MTTSGKKWKRRSKNSRAKPFATKSGILSLNRFFTTKAISPTNPGSKPWPERLEKIDQERGTRGNRLFYFAVGPEQFEPILKHLKTAGLNNAPEGSWARVIVEKPFGTDLKSARELNRVISTSFSEEQTYRIDHFLGKETAQNILVLRFANAIFEPLWNTRYIDHVQITAAETLGVEGRAGYYETAGALRDMVQNHLLQLLCLVAMEAPSDLARRQYSR